LEQTVYSYGSLFAGIGGLCAGFAKNGFEGHWANDILESSHEAYLPNHQIGKFICDSIANLDANTLRPVDVLHGGFPCQSFSQAGNREGFDDPRGALFFEIIRLLNDFGTKRPSIVLLENSPYIRIGNNGDWLETIKWEIQGAGYWFSDQNIIDLNARDHGGLPQRRNRAFLVAVRDDVFDWNPITRDLFSVAESIKPLSDILQLGEVTESKFFLEPENKYATLLAEKLVNDPYRIYQLRKFEVRRQEEGFCPTLTANMGAGGHNVPFVFDQGRFRKLTDRECLSLQGFPPSFEFPHDMPLSKRYALIGNAVSPAVSNLLAKVIKEFLVNHEARLAV